MRDSVYILAGLLEQQTSLEPKEIMTDTACRFGPPLSPAQIQAVLGRKVKIRIDRGS